MITKNKKKTLIVYESSSKFITFKAAFEGDSYTLAFTGGHLLDLPKDEIGVTSGNIKDIALKFIKPAQEKWIKDKIKSHDTVFCLTDNDSEGEFIASNIKDLCTILETDFYRVRVSDLTKESILNAVKVKSPELDESLISQSISRRVIDRLIGYHDNKVKRLKRGRVFTPLLSSIQKKPISKITYIEYFFRSGIKLGIDVKKGQETIFLNALETFSDKDFILTQDEEHEAYNTYDFMEEKTKKGGNSSEAFSELQSSYENGDISYPRTENRKFYVHENNHSGIKSTKNVSLSDILKESNEGIRNILIKTLAQQNENVLVFNAELSSNMYEELSKKGLIRCCGIKIVYLETRFNERILSDEHYINHRSHNNTYNIYDPSVDYYILERMNELEIGTPSTLSYHVENARNYIKDDERLTPNYHAMKNLNADDYMTDRLKKISISKSINILLHNNDLKVEEKLKKCLNVLHLRSDNVNDIDLDNNY
jgi:DNA topoisomerase IA